MLGFPRETDQHKKGNDKSEPSIIGWCQEAILWHAERMFGDAESFLYIVKHSNDAFPHLIVVKFLKKRLERFLCLYKRHSYKFRILEIRT